MTTETAEPLSPAQKAARTRAARRAAAAESSSPAPEKPARKERTTTTPTAEIVARADAEHLHRIHAAPAMGKGGRSFDLAGYRWRPAEAETHARDAQAVAFRMALCWNLAEGICTATLEAGALRKEAEAVVDLLDAIERGAPAAELAPLASAVRAAGALVEAGIDRREGRLHDCPACTSKKGTDS